MDGRHFDDMARRLVTGPDRRRVLGLGLGTMMGGVLTLLGHGATAAARADEVETSADVKRFRQCRRRCYTICDQELGGTILQDNCRNRCIPCCRDIAAGRRCTAFR